MTVDYDVDIRATIESYLESLFPDTPIAWQGLDFDPPQSLWLRPYIVVGGEMAKGFAWDEVVGAFVCEVFCPRNTGQKPLYDAIAILKQYFYRKKINNLYLKNIQGIRDLTDNPSYLGKAIDIEFIGYSLNY